MKHYTCILWTAATLLAIVSCSREREFAPEGDAAGYELLFRADVEGMATRATDPDESARKEDAVNTLDVFIYGTFKGDSEPSVKGYHLTTDDKVGDNWRITQDWRQEKLVPGQNYKLYVAANSSKVKTADDSSDSSVATTTLSAMGINSLEELGDAIEFDYNPAEDNTVGGNKPFWGSHNDDGVNPAWLSVHKKYTSSTVTDIAAVDKADRYFTHDKSFLMNGTSEEFTVPAGSNTAGITAPSVTLNRAAAKIRINVHFSEAFLNKLSTSKKWTLCGAPQWRFSNFAFNTPVFSDLPQAGTYDPTVSRFTSSANMIGDDDIDGNDIDGNDLEYGSGNDRRFSFSTYSYPLSWTAATADEEAPAIILSVGYRDDTNASTILEANRPVTYQAYKIRVVNPEETIYSLDRNNIYTIDATISSEGSTLVTDAYPIKAAYNIIRWSDDANVSPISERNNSYIDVIPDALPESTDVTDVVLRGDGVQTVRLHVLKPGTKDFGIKYYTKTGATPSNPFAQSSSALASADYTSGSPAAYYFNYNGTAMTTIAVNGGSAGNVQLSITKDGEYIVISSEALANKGVKFAKIRVYLNGAQSIYRDINIRHLPTDALMVLEGQWSSRQSARNRLPSSNKNYVGTADRIPGAEDYTYTKDLGSWNRTSWENYPDGYKWEEWWECTAEQYAGTPARDRRIAIVGITKEEYEAHQNEEGYSYEGTNAYEPNFFYYNGEQMLSGSGFTNLSPRNWTEANPGYYDGYYCWGAGSVSASDWTTEAKWDCDYYEIDDRTSWGTTTRYYRYYKYERRYRKRYLGPQYQRIRFRIASVQGLPSSFPTWLNWSVDVGESYDVISMKGARYHDGRPQGFYSRVYNSSESQIYAYSGTNSISMDSPVNEDQNRHLYVVQFSETASSYNIGRPNRDELTKLSNDNVVSPAFLVASQLGGLNEIISVGEKWRPVWAALHCASYLEVVKDSKGNDVYYSDWRLPTREEIEVIINYQDKRSGDAIINGNTLSGDNLVLKAVLYAKQYYALDGSLVDTNYGGTNIATVRCVRDLTSEELEALNK